MTQLKCKSQQETSHLDELCSLHSAAATDIAAGAGTILSGAEIFVCKALTGTILSPWKEAEEVKIGFCTP